MTNYDNTNKGALWKNDKKQTDNHPDFKGSVNIDGREYWLSGWKRSQGANPNSPALKLSVQPKVAPQVAGIQNQNYQPERPQRPDKPIQTTNQPNPANHPQPTGFDAFDDDEPPF